MNEMERFWEIMTVVAVFLPIELASKLADPVLRHLFTKQPDLIKSIIDSMIKREFTDVNGQFIANLCYLYKKTNDERIKKYLDDYKNYLLKFLENEYERMDRYFESIKDNEEEIVKYIAFAFPELIEEEAEGETVKS
uniref:Uncharacterized protein n=1 Tax=candidate division WOR-3 bacterium TaxID=2052148 RepID=A0A7V3ZT72_UNCW3